MPVSVIRRDSISIHALREEGDRKSNIVIVIILIFLSTPSARRATVERLANRTTAKFLSTPSARRATAKTEKNISAFVSL